MGLFGRKKSPPASDVDDSSPGWESIQTAFAVAFPDVEDLHFAPGAPVSLGGALDGISAYPTAAGWHFVTFGLTELHTKQSEDTKLSGWGYELTLLTPPSDEPPAWALRLLHGLAKATWSSGHPHDIGDRIALGGPLDGDESKLTAIAVMSEPAATPGQFPLGHYAFHRLVGITDGELQDMKDSSTETVLQRLSATNPLHVTDPGRAS
ncbi:hypothetical protein DSM112329_02857 [Paraconexibacter sp. AEG42_29]|uniref:Suppressor of fused-like domain-containing protein n=1 Tax=Paraconexibacter sp. AEG42_29 TaxID=2997339 RepID=A0AAU7AWD0_9ACTN